MSERSLGAAHRRRKVRNELMARGLNEKIESLVELSEPGPVEQQAVAFLCECADDQCAERITLTVSRYDELHHRRDDFILRPGHQGKDVERVVDSETGYLVVRKIDLEA
jgi:hypothetical protein